MGVRAAAGRFGGGSGLYHRSGRTGAYEVAFGRDGHFAGTGLAVEIRLKAFAGRVDQNEAVQAEAALGPWSEGFRGTP